MRNLLATLLAVSCAAPRPAPQREALLDCWAAALGGREKLLAIRSIRRVAVLESQGLTGKLTAWSRADGAHREEESLGPSSDETVFDGEHAWYREGFGAPLPLSHTELARERTNAWLESFGPLLRAGGVARPGSRPGTLVIAAPGGFERLLSFDEKTCLPLQEEIKDGPEVRTNKYLQWATVGGVKFPAEIESRGTRDPGEVTRFRYTATALDEPAGPFEKPFTPAHPLAAPVTLPAELTQNHVYVQAGVNGKGPVALLVDTGASGLILDAAKARALDLGGTGNLKVFGAGAGSLESQVIARPSLDLGTLHIAVEAARTANLGALSLREGRAMEGILGYEVLGHFVTEFDYAAPAVRLHDAATFTPPPDAVALPFYFFDTKPIVRGEVELQDGRRLALDVLVDTGDRGAFALESNFVRANHVLEGKGPFLRAPLGFGVGGQTKQALGRIAALRLGSVEVRDVLTSFSEDERGAMADDTVQANLGSELLKQFTVWFDYPRQLMYLRRNAHFGEPFEYDMSGLLLVSADETFRRAEVRSVLDGSPGAQAGIEAGDEIVTVDGRPVSKLDDVRDLLRKPGQRVRFELRRKDRTLQVEVLTRRMI